MKKISVLFIMAMLVVCPMFAQKDAKQILDKTSSMLRGAGAIHASFTADSFDGGTKKGSAAGIIAIKGNKFRIMSEGLTTWFDGKTQWTYIKGSDEVNVSSPSKAEQQAANPYTFVNLYKQGYKLQLMKDENVRGGMCYTVKMVAQSKGNNIQEMLLTIDKKSFVPICIRMRQGAKKWTRISVSGFRGKQKFADTYFQFNSKDYPQAEVIDLR